MDIWIIIEVGSTIPPDLEDYPVAEVILSKAFKTRTAAQQWINQQSHSDWLEPCRLSVQE